MIEILWNPHGNRIFPWFPLLARLDGTDFNGISQAGAGAVALHDAQRGAIAQLSHLKGAADATLLRRAIGSCHTWHKMSLPQWLNGLHRHVALDTLQGWVSCFSWLVYSIFSRENIKLLNQLVDWQKCRHVGQQRWWENPGESLECHPMWNHEMTNHHARPPVGYWLIKQDQF